MRWDISTSCVYLKHSLFPVCKFTKRLRYHFTAGQSLSVRNAVDGSNFRRLLLDAFHESNTGVEFQQNFPANDMKALLKISVGGEVPLGVTSSDCSGSSISKLLARVPFVK